MPEQSVQQQHVQTLRQNVLRRLSRSPHPYHRQHFELPHPSEHFSSEALPTGGSARHLSEDEGGVLRPAVEGYRESTNSDSGTEADDEHFLKGLPAPKLRPHKGLRGENGSLSSSPSPAVSPKQLIDDPLHSLNARKDVLRATITDEQERRKAALKMNQKRRVEIVRRLIEAALLLTLGGLICLDSRVRFVFFTWREGMSCERIAQAHTDPSRAFKSASCVGNTACPVPFTLNMAHFD